MAPSAAAAAKATAAAVAELTARVNKQDAMLERMAELTARVDNQDARLDRIERMLQQLLDRSERGTAAAPASDDNVHVASPSPLGTAGEDVEATHQTSGERRSSPSVTPADELSEATVRVDRVVGAAALPDSSQTEASAPCGPTGRAGIGTTQPDGLDWRNALNRGPDPTTDVENEDAQGDEQRAQADATARVAQIAAQNAELTAQMANLKALARKVLQAVQARYGPLGGTDGEPPPDETTSATPLNTATGDSAGTAVSGDSCSANNGNGKSSDAAPASNGQGAATSNAGPQRTSTAASAPTANPGSRQSAGVAGAEERDAARGHDGEATQSGGAAAAVRSEGAAAEGAEEPPWNVPAAGKQPVAPARSADGAALHGNAHALDRGPAGSGRAEGAAPGRAYADGTASDARTRRTPEGGRDPTRLSSDAEARLADPPLFTGESDAQFAAWRDGCLRQFDNKPWAFQEETQGIAYARSYLSGAAETYVNSFAPADDYSIRENTDWHAFLAMVEGSRQFLPPPSSTLFKLLCIRQGTGEALGAFLMRFRVWERAAQDHFGTLPLPRSMSEATLLQAIKPESTAILHHHLGQWRAGLLTWDGMIDATISAADSHVARQEASRRRDHFEHGPRYEATANGQQWHAASTATAGGARAPW